MANTAKVTGFLQQEKADVIVMQEVVRHLSDRVQPTYRTKEEIEQALAHSYRPYRK